LRREKERGGLRGEDRGGKDRRGEGRVVQDITRQANRDT
jgi:hypothetical protein